LAFWCFIGFTICTIVSLSCVDSVQLWRVIRQRHRHSYGLGYGSVRAGND
jgi:hypothetical protein